jgi:hypothetical protein
MTAKRLDDAGAKKITDATAVFDKRFKDQSPAPGSEAAVRRMIEELRVGKPNYDLLRASLVNMTRQQLPQLQSMITDMALCSQWRLRESGQAAPIFYQLKFEKGSLDYRIWLGRTEKSKIPTCDPANNPLGGSN